MEAIIMKFSKVPVYGKFIQSLAWTDGQIQNITKEIRRKRMKTVLNWGYQDWGFRDNKYAGLRVCIKLNQNVWSASYSEIESKFQRYNASWIFPYNKGQTADPFGHRLLPDDRVVIFIGM